MPRLESISPATCIVQGCRGDTRGQMLSCAPHWSFLSRPLQLELVDCERELATQRAAGNVRRATRERWKVLVAMVERELAEGWAALVQQAMAPVGPDGAEWVRVRRRLMNEAEPETAEVAP